MSLMESNCVRFSQAKLVFITRWKFLTLNNFCCHFSNVRKFVKDRGFSSSSLPVLISIKGNVSYVWKVIPHSLKLEGGSFFMINSLRLFQFCKDIWFNYLPSAIWFVWFLCFCFRMLKILIEWNYFCLINWFFSGKWIFIEWIDFFSSELIFDDWIPIFIDLIDFCRLNSIFFKFYWFWSIKFRFLSINSVFFYIFFILTCLPSSPSRALVSYCWCWMFDFDQWFFQFSLWIFSFDVKRK